ncbi:MAG TPA: Rha family transcriptional regulator [Desulfosporosinus sp.]
MTSTDYFIESSYRAESGKRSHPCFLVTKKGCKMIATRLTGKKGILFSAAYVTRFEKTEKSLLAQVRDSYMIEDPIAIAQHSLFYGEK